MKADFLRCALPAEKIVFVLWQAVSRRGGNVGESQVVYGIKAVICKQLLQYNLQRNIVIK